jgi:hypothetical protein
MQMASRAAAIALGQSIDESERRPDVSIRVRANGAIGHPTKSSDEATTEFDVTALTAVIFSVRAEVDPISPCESETRLKAGAGAVPLRRHRLVGRNRANPS